MHIAVPNPSLPLRALVAALQPRPPRGRRTTPCRTADSSKAAAARARRSCKSVHPPCRVIVSITACPHVNQTRAQRAGARDGVQRGGRAEGAVPFPPPHPPCLPAALGSYLVLRGAGHCRHGGVVLGGRPQHAWAPDVNVLHAVSKATAGGHLGACPHTAQRRRRTQASIHVHTPRRRRHTHTHDTQDLTVHTNTCPHGTHESS